MKALHRRLVFAVLIALLLTNVPVSAQASEEVTLQVWLIDASWSIHNPLWLIPEYIEWFEANNPNVKIELNLYTGNRVERYILNAASGIPMDVIWTSGGDVVPIEEMLLDLNPFVEKDPLMKTNFLNPHFVRSGEWRGRLISFPDILTWRAVYVNKNAFESQGLELPSLHATDTWTMDEFVEAAQRLRRVGPDGEVTRHGFSIGTDAERYEMWARLFGGKLYDSATDTVVADSPEAIDSFDMLRRMAVEMDVLPQNNIGSKTGVNNLIFDEVGMYLGPDTHIPLLTDAMNDQYTVRPLPRGPAGTTGVIGAPGWNVIAETKHPEIAYRFVRDRAFFYAGVRDLDNLPMVSGLEAHALPYEGTAIFDDLRSLLGDWLAPTGFPRSETLMYIDSAISSPIVRAITEFVHGRAPEAPIREAVRIANNALAGNTSP